MTEVRFTVYADTYDEIHAKAFAEVKRFFGELLVSSVTWDVYAHPIGQLVDGTIIGYEADVTAVLK